MRKTQNKIFLVVLFVTVALVVAFYMIYKPNLLVSCDSEGKSYISRDAARCELLRFQCVSGERPFSDSCGCGCEKIFEENFCDSPRPEFCPEIYSPVCGLFDSEKIQCIRAPCGSTYSNRCFACADENVISWTTGACE